MNNVTVKPLASIMKNLASPVAIALLLFAGLVGTVIATPQASAQTAVTGTADFRNAPQLIPGAYRDTVVTGDSAWYALVYSNDTPYRFEASIDGAQPSDVDVVTSFVAPTLQTVASGSSVVEGAGVAYPTGHTNVWFLKVSLETSGQAGIQYPITISIDGVLTAGTEDCSATPTCTLDDELKALAGEIVEAEAQRGLVDPTDTLTSVEAELRGLRSSADSAARTTRPNAQNRLARAEAAAAELCAPQLTCDEFPDPGSKTPLLGWIVGLAALGGGAYKAFNNLRDDESNDADDGETGGDSTAVGSPEPAERPAIAL